MMTNVGTDHACPGMRKPTERFWREPAKFKNHTYKVGKVNS